MKKVRKLGYLVILFSLILVGCGRQDEKDAERLSQLNAKVESLFNEEITDLAPNNSVAEFEETASDIEAEREHDLNEENEARFEEIEELYADAVKMNDLEMDILAVFSDDVLKEGVRFHELQALSAELAEIDATKWTDYVPRQEERIAEAKDQLKIVERAADLVASLYSDYNVVNPEVTREEEKTAKEAVSEVKNETIRENLENRLEKVDAAITEREEEEQKKATEGVGFFEGMFLSDDDFILSLDEELLLYAQNDASDNLAYYEVTAILSNTGQELTLALYQEPVEVFNIEGGEDEQTFYLSEDYETITTEDDEEFHRLTQEEIDEIYDRLPGLKNPGDWRD